MMRNKTLSLLLVAFLTAAFAGCLGGPSGEPSAYVAGDHQVPSPFMVASTENNSTAAFFDSTGMEENPGAVPPQQFGGEQTGAEDAYGALLVHEGNSSRMIFWSAVGFANGTAAEDFVNSIEINQGCPSFAGVLRAGSVVALLQTTPGEETAAAAQDIADELETSMGMDAACSDASAT